MKKILSLLLAAVMVLSMMVVVPITASAEGNTFDTSDYANTTNFTISTAEDLMTFASYVATGKNFSGKVVSVKADIALPSNSGWIGIGDGDNAEDCENNKHFRGTFDGEGHTIDLGNVTTGGNHKGGLFRGVGDGAIIKNFTLLGNITFGGGHQSIGGVACRLWGTVTISNVRNSVNFTNTSESQVKYNAGFVGFIQNNKGVDLTIDGCVYDGTINSRNGAEYLAGFVGYTGDNKANKTVTIQNSVYAGKMMFNDKDDSKWNSPFIAYLKGSSSTDYVPTAIIKDCVSVGTMTYNQEKNWSSSAYGALVVADTKSTVQSITITNFYYLNITKADKTGNMALVVSDNADDARYDSYGSSMTLEQIAGLTAKDFSQSDVFSFKENTHWDTYYPCPTSMLVDNAEAGTVKLVKEGAWVDSLMVSVDAQVLGAQIRITEKDDPFSGIRFIAEFRESVTAGAGTADANFGLILVSKTAYETWMALEGEAKTFDALVAAGAQVAATKSTTANGVVTVKAVVYEIAEAYYSEGIVAIPYANGAVIGDAVERSIYSVAKACVEANTDSELAIEFATGIVATVEANAEA